MHPVVGLLLPDDNAIALGTGYSKFRTSYFKMDGLCKVDGRKIEFLVVATDDPGQGHFRKFVDQLKLHYHEIYIWLDWNPELGPILQRYAFTRVTSKDSDGSVIKGWVWKS